MRVGGAKAFVKTRACPSSDDISNLRLSLGKSDQMARHLAGCDFCAAQQSHLSASSRTTGEYEPPEMPAHLVAWAEACSGESSKILIGDEIRKAAHRKSVTRGAGPG
jgi:hypothetical protein